MLRRVDLPLPLGPKTVVILCAGMDREKSEKTCFLPNDLHIDDISTIFSFPIEYSPHFLFFEMSDGHHVDDQFGDGSADEQDDVKRVEHVLPEEKGNHYGVLQGKQCGKTAACPD